MAKQEYQPYGFTVTNVEMLFYDGTHEKLLLRDTHAYDKALLDAISRTHSKYLLGEVVIVVGLPDADF